MLQRELAAQTGITVTKLQEIMVDNGMNPDQDPVNSTIIDRIRQIFCGSQSQPVALPESNQSEPEPEAPKRKRGRPSKDSQLATKATESIQKTGAATHQVKANYANQVNTLEMLAGAALGQQATAAYAEGFLRARAAGQSQFLSNYVGTLAEAIKSDQSDFNPTELAEKLGLDPSSDFLEVGELPLSLEMLNISLSI